MTKIGTKFFFYLKILTIDVQAYIVTLLTDTAHDSLFAVFLSASQIVIIHTRKSMVQTDNDTSSKKHFKRDCL